MELWREPLLLKNKHKQQQQQQFTESRICASATRFATFSDRPDVKRSTAMQETPESQLQAARAIINEYHQPRTSSNSIQNQRKQQRVLPLKMTVSRTAKRKLDFPAVQNKRRHFFTQSDSMEDAELPYLYSQFSQKTERSSLTSSASTKRKSQLGSFTTNFKAAQENFYSGKSYFYVPQSTQDLKNVEEEIFEDEDNYTVISHEELITKYSGQPVDADVIEQDGLSAVERSYSNLMNSFDNRHTSKPGFGGLMENASPALNSFGQMFNAAKENFYSHEIADYDESSSTFSPKSTTAKRNFYSEDQDESSFKFSPKSTTTKKNFFAHEIEQSDESSSLKFSPTSILGKLFDVSGSPLDFPRLETNIHHSSGAESNCHQEKDGAMRMDALKKKLGSMDTPDLLKVIEQLRKECHEMF